MLTDNKAWVISAYMGLGHQRAAFPFRGIAEEDILAFGEDYVDSQFAKTSWEKFRKFYERLTTTKNVPLLGPMVFSLLDKMLGMPPLYPNENKQDASLGLRTAFYFIKKGFGQKLYDHIKSHPAPIITSFFMSSIAAEVFTDHPVFCILCDTDINRAWAPLDPKNSRINFCAPCKKVVRRLIQYGVPEKNIHLTGFPLPHENLGGTNITILKNDVAKRINILDATGNYKKQHKDELSCYLGENVSEYTQTKPLTLTFSIGGAGAQTDIAHKAFYSLLPLIKLGKLKVNLAAGIRTKVFKSFEKLVQKVSLDKHPNINIIYSPNLFNYLEKFNQSLRSTDILWTKPSELTFYSGLGIPVIISPPIGPHEESNMDWLIAQGAGILQDDVKYSSEWITDYLVDNRFVKACWNGFVNVEKLGIYKIAELAFAKAHNSWDDCLA